MPRPRPPRRRIGPAILRAIGAAGITAGAGRALGQDGSGGPNDALQDRLLVEQVPRHGDAPRDDGLLDRVPGWVLLAAVALLFVLAPLWGFR